MLRAKSRKGALAALTAVLTLCVAVAVASAEIGTSKDGSLRISFHGGIAPVKLPRKELAPVGVQMGAKIKTTDGTQPPRLSKIILDINSHGEIETKGLPRCTLGKLHNSSAARARKVCGDAEVGHGNVTSRVKLPGQGEFATNGPLLAFNGRYKGKPAIFAHVTSKGTLAITYVIIFVIKQTKGTFGTSLVADVPQIASGTGYISAFDLSLKRRYSLRGEKRSYVSASCPLPNGVNRANFDFARSTYEFEDGESVTSVLQRECRARG
jgi:hypothetical protein